MKRSKTAFVILIPLLVMAVWVAYLEYQTHARRVRQSPPERNRTWKPD